MNDKVYSIEICNKEIRNNLSSNSYVEFKNEKCPTLIVKGKIQKSINLKHDGSLPINIIVEKNSEANIVEVSEIVKSAKITLDIAENANITHIALEPKSMSNVISIERETTVGASSKYNFYYTSVADSDLNYIHNVKLLEKEAECNLHQVSLSTNKQKLKYNNKITHLASYTSGYIECIGASFDVSNITFNTTGEIAKGYKGSSARQTNKGIMIGEKSQIEANPFLLIEEYDVSASHGATIGRMNDEELYYLMSRGLTKQESYLLMIEGYFANSINKIDNEEIKTIFNGELVKKLA